MQNHYFYDTAFKIGFNYDAHQKYFHTFEMIKYLRKPLF